MSFDAQFEAKISTYFHEGGEYIGPLANPVLFVIEVSNFIGILDHGSLLHPVYFVAISFSS